ncbi:MAG TPA: flagellar biosynthesis anti-sigma factor FlgM [Bacillales bacterium]|nr:flagellar biosynthesis anti-sigma factor FlgM [Bacillales bacterium]
MKINGVNHSNMNPYTNRPDQTQLQKGSRPKDEIEISREAKQLQQQSGIFADRKEKIEALKQKIDAGQYEIDAYHTARKFYEFWMGGK